MGCRSMFSGLMLLAGLGCGAPALAQGSGEAPTAVEVLGQMITLSYYGQKCDVTLSPAQEKGLEAASEAMMAKAGVTKDNMMEVYKQVTSSLPDADCSQLKPIIPGEVDNLLAAAKRVP